MIVKFAKLLRVTEVKTGVGVLIFGVNRSRIGVGFCNFGAGLESESQKSDSGHLWRDPVNDFFLVSGTEIFFSRPTVFISLLCLFRQCACFSTVLISLQSLLQCCKFFQRVLKTRCFCLKL